MLDWIFSFTSFAHILSGWTLGALLIAGGAFIWFRVPALGHYIGLAAIATGCALIWGAVQYDAAAGACKEAEARALLSASHAREIELQRQIDTSRTIEQAAQTREQTARDGEAAANQRIAEYDALLAKQGAAGACALDDDLWNRLR